MSNAKKKKAKDLDSEIAELIDQKLNETEALRKVLKEIQRKQNKRKHKEK